MNSTCGHELAPDGHSHPVYDKVKVGKEVGRVCCACGNHKPSAPDPGTGVNIKGRDECKKPTPVSVHSPDAASQGQASETKRKGGKDSKRQKNNSGSKTSNLGAGKQPPAPVAIIPSDIYSTLIADGDRILTPTEAASKAISQAQGDAPTSTKLQGGTRHGKDTSERRHMGRKGKLLKWTQTQQWSAEGYRIEKQDEKIFILSGVGDDNIRCGSFEEAQDRAELNEKQNQELDDLDEKYAGESKDGVK